jgi:integrase
MVRAAAKHGTFRRPKLLSDTRIRAAKARPKPYKISDGQQLYLYVTTAGGKLWRMNYQYDEKQRTMSFGSYPMVSLAEARQLRDKAKRELFEGNDPGIVKKVEVAERRKKNQLTFEILARAWHETNKSRWAEVHTYDVIHSLERDVFPAIGKLPIDCIDAPTVLKVLRKVEARGSIETAKRLRQRVSAAFVYGIAEGLTDRDPAALIGKALKPMPPKRKQPALLELSALQKILKDVDASGAEPVTRLALRLLALTAVRPGELRGAEWSEFEDLEGAEPLWRIPASRMKGSIQRKIESGDHLVPLSSHAVDVLKALRSISGLGPLAFPSVRHSHRPMSENAIGYLLNRVGYHGRHVPHGWRAAFSTFMNEWTNVNGQDGDREVIDLMLAHIQPNKVEGAYNRAAYMPRRRALAQIWGDLLMADVAKPSTLGSLPRRSL